MAAVRELGMKLTVDTNGNDATSADFDPANIVQWGFDSQWADNSPTAETALFGAGSFLADDGKTAQIPDAMRTGIKWFNDGVWKDHFIPTQNQVNSDLLAKGNPFQSGNLAMTEIHTWYSCCVNPAAPAKPIVGDNFGWAVAPAYNGTTTAKLHADTFSMLKTTKHPDEAFEALSALAGSGELATIYGAMPADPAQQQPFKDAVDAAVPDGRPRLGRPEGDARLPGHPQPPGLGPGLRQEQGRVAGVRQRLPHAARAPTSTPTSTRSRPPSRASSTLPRTRTPSSSSTGLPGGRPTAREADPALTGHPRHQRSPARTHDCDDRGAADDAVCPPTRRMVLRPSVREALWGYVFIGPWLIGLVLFTAGPMIASFAMSLTDFNLVQARDDEVHRHRQLRADGERPDDRASRSSRRSSSR